MLESSSFVWCHVFYSGRSAAWLACLVRDQEVGGSNPLAPTTENKEKA